MKTNNLQLFENAEFGSIRTVSIDNEAYFVSKDVAVALGYSNSRKAIADHVDDEDKGVTKCDTLGGSQDLSIINESGLYALIFGSKLKSARRFKRWVTSEVLPAIRKTGTYKMETSNVITRDLTTDDYKDAVRWISRCWRDKEVLSIVLNFLEKGGYDISKVQLENKNISYNGFHEKFKRLLDERGIAPTNFAKQCGLPKSGVCGYYKGEHVPKDRNLKIITQVLEIPEDYFK